MTQTTVIDQDYTTTTEITTTVNPPTDTNTELIESTTQSIDSTTQSAITEAVETTTNSVETTTAAICPPGYFGNVPHPYRCDAFYMCTGSMSLLLTCGEGFEYDDNEKVS